MKNRGPFNAYISAVGHYFPEKVISNQILCLTTSIRQMNGFEQEPELPSEDLLKLPANIIHGS